MMLRIATIFIAASACWTCANAQKSPEPQNSDCPTPSAVAQRHLIGVWQAQVDGERLTLHLGPHPELSESVRGTLQRAGRTVQLAGDVDAGAFTLEESDDGRRISATWLGDVAPGSCGQEIRGQWSRAAAPGVQHPFTLRKLLSPGW